MTTVYVDGKRHQLPATKIIGGGGEADVYDLGAGRVLKLYKRPDDPAYALDAGARAGAQQRLEECQAKLPAFPAGLPPEVVAPLGLAYGRAGGPIVGYTMPYISGAETLLMYGDRRYREHSGVDGNQVLAVFRQLHRVVGELHHQRVVIGDFNDLNVLVRPDGAVHLVDADSMQYGSFVCRAFTARFADPLHCPADQLMPNQPHDANSDWYAYAVMLMQSLLYVGPYGGVHRPKMGPRLQHDARVLQRLTVFGPDVIYPKPALPYGVLSDELLEQFRRIYEQDRRGEFPLSLLEAMRWTTCTNCQLAHARGRCPQCAKPGAVRETTTIRGAVTATRVFRTHGRILHATWQAGALRYLYHEAEAFRRETGAVVAPGELDPQVRYRLCGDITLIGRRQRLVVLTPNQPPHSVVTDMAGALPVFDANEQHWFWIQDGQLKRNGTLAAEYVGDVLPERTLFWVGSRFGLGFYRAGQLMRTFVFRIDRPGLNDQVPVAALTGQLIDATCVFSDHLAWFMTSTQEQGRLINHCTVVDERGAVLGTALAAQDETSWLAQSIRGRFASGQSLFAATDEGLVRITVEAGDLLVSQRFPDTEPFVDQATQLLPGPGGIHAISGQSITLLRIK